MNVLALELTLLACKDVMSLISTAISSGLASVSEPSKSRMMTRSSGVTRMLRLCRSPCKTPALWMFSRAFCRFWSSAWCERAFQSQAWPYKKSSAQKI